MGNTVEAMDYREIYKPPENIWDVFKLRDGTVGEPDPNRFSEITEGIPKGDIPQVGLAIAFYSIERSGLLLSPEQLSQPLEQLQSGTYNQDVDILDEFFKYCNFADEVWNKIEQAHQLASQYSVDQLKILQEKTRSADDLPQIKIIRAMQRSDDPSFKRVGDRAKSHSSAILRILHAWEKDMRKEIADVDNLGHLSAVPQSNA